MSSSQGCVELSGLLSQVGQAAARQVEGREQRQEGPHLVVQQVGGDIQPLLGRSGGEEPEPAFVRQQPVWRPLFPGVLHQKPFGGAALCVEPGECLRAVLGMDDGDRPSFESGEVAAPGPLLDLIAEFGDDFPPIVGRLQIFRRADGVPPAGRVLLEAHLDGVAGEQPLHVQASPVEPDDLSGQMAHRFEVFHADGLLDGAGESGSFDRADGRVDRGRTQDPQRSGLFGVVRHQQVARRRPADPFPPTGAHTGLAGIERGGHLEAVHGDHAAGVRAVRRLPPRSALHQVVQ